MLFILMQTSAMAAKPWSTVYSVDTPGLQTLRAFGRVNATNKELRNSKGELVWVQIFRCENNEKADTLAGKFLSDLTLTDGIKNGLLKVGALTVPFVVFANGSVFVCCVDGVEARVFSGESLKTLQAYLQTIPSQASGAITTAKYPHYLDRFDRYGWGSYGVDSFDSPEGPDKKDGINPTEDVQFLIDNKFRTDLWLDPTEFDFGDGLMKATSAEWISRMLSDAGQPFSFRVYGSSGGSNWSDRRFPEYTERPAPFLQSGWHGAQQFYTPQAHFSWFQPDIQRYITVQTMEMMKQYNDNPSLTGWMHPQGELQHDEWYDMHDDYSPVAQKSWRNYLQQHGVQLEEATRMYHTQDKPFSDWDQVLIPEFATFEGLGKQVLSLEGTWNYRVDIPSKTVLNDAWYTKSQVDRYPGVKERWYSASMKPGEWSSMRLPGNDAIYGLFRENGNDTMSTWFRRSFILNAAQQAQPKIYLYFYPISNTSIHMFGFKARYHEIYINGVKAGEVGGWGALDVTKLLQQGENTIALHLLGSRWNGRMYLSTQAPRVFPNFGEDMNKLWVLWKDWHVDAKYAAWRDTLDGMRQVDPNRPIKFMAPQGFGTDKWISLAHDYGGFPHFTGEGMWYYPWYKRYAFLYDVPGSSETAGPANNLGDQFDSFRRTFLAGLNAHDPVFVIQTYSRNTDLKKFWLTHDPVLKQMGRYDLDARQQIILYRSSKMDIGYVQDPPYPLIGTIKETQRLWNWDIGRGTLQTIGQSYLYLDDGGLKDGKMNGFPVMIDCGNEIMPVDSVKTIADWVKSGGIFVTLPFTGRSTTSAPDTWPIRELTGCEISRTRAPGQGKIIIGAKQSVFKAFAGKIFDDNGHTTDWQGGEHNLLSTELKPGTDCEVLAAFENGTPAIIKRKIGKGYVIVLGTAFWRDSKDIKGLWWPGKIETDFLADLLQGLNFAPAACTSDDQLVWAQPYISNNGLEAVTTLVSWHDDKAVTVKVTMRLPRKPSRLVSFGVDGVKYLPFTWKNGVAETSVVMPAKEVKVINADVATPNEALTHWWDYQQRMWHELARSTVDFSPYTKGKFADPTIELRRDAKLTIDQPVDDAWTMPGFDDKTWKPCFLGLLNSYGAQPKKPVYVRKTFTVPSEWLDKGGKIYLTSAAWSGVHYQGASRMSLNGKMLHDFTTGSFNEFDVTRLVNTGENALTFTFKGENTYQGFSGNVWLYYGNPPVSSLPISGVWNGTVDGKLAAITLPGAGSLKMPTRTIFIPKDWEGKYQVRLYMEGNNWSILGAWVNGRMVRRHHHSLGTRCDIDITSQLKYGQDNEFILANGGDTNGMDFDPKAFTNWDIKIMRMDLYPVK